MVKPDLKHNYYADLELPTTASIDDIKKQYRKLALLYHPDRNAGKEEEYVPKFQAIQTAHEVLGDVAQKAKYDADRKKAGLYPGARTPTQPTTGNPYTANSAYPPPPRRTQPGTWQRPQQTPPAASASQGSGPGPTPASAPSGADRFSNFPRAAPTARKDPAQDRTNMFRAWQNMNNAQERQSGFQANPPPPGPRGPPPPTPARPRPPPRNESKMPSEEEIRAGMNYRKPPPQHDGARSEERQPGQTAWAAFQQANAGKPGVTRSGTTRTPRKQGFDPNAPGSDERPAGGSNYATRHRSADFGQPGNGAPFPPPPPGPPPHSPLSPGATTPSARPYADPLRPFKSRETQDPQVPFTEGNRIRTPYGSSYGVGERTEVSSDGLRRSASTRDATKLHAQNGADSRARSTSPLGRHNPTKGHQQGDSGRKPFVNYSSSEPSDDEQSTARRADGGYDNVPPNSGTAGRPQSASHADRPKRYPTPPSKRFNGSGYAFSPPPTSDGAQSESETAGMRQKTNNNMYASLSDYFFQHSFSFYRGESAADMLGKYPTYTAEPQRRNAGPPDWAVPSPFAPTRRGMEHGNDSTAFCEAESTHTARDTFVLAPRSPSQGVSEQQRALSYFKRQLEQAYGEVPDNCDMEIFLKLASTVSKGGSSGNSLLDGIVKRTLLLYMLDDSLTRSYSPFADTRFRGASFTLPVDHDLFPPNNKSRSEEHINTKFSPDGWNGAFTGASGYFAPPTSQSNGRKATSPPRRGSQRSGLRSATTQVPTGASSETEMPPPRRPFGSDGQHQQQPETTPSEVKFSKEQWEKTFQDASWTWPPPPPKPPSPSKAGAKARMPGRKASRSSAQSTGAGTQSQPHVISEDSDEAAGESVTGDDGAPIADEGDAMDIDSTPPAQQQQGQAGASTAGDGTKEPRLYSVPPSTWRQQQQQQANGYSRRASHPGHGEGEARLNTNLDDLANVEPLAHSANGLKNLADMSSTLPFESRSSGTLPSHPLEPHKLRMPSVPKAPEPPPKLTKQSWHAFSEAFAAYLQAYHAFNKTMLAHFEARESQAQARMAGGCAWLEAAGDTSGALTSGSSGYGSYLQGVKEDEQVRETWSLGCERHADACKGFEKTRERVKKLAAVGGLADVPIYG